MIVSPCRVDDQHTDVHCVDSAAKQVVHFTNFHKQTQDYDNAGPKPVLPFKHNSEGSYSCCDSLVGRLISTDNQRQINYKAKTESRRRVSGPEACPLNSVDRTFGACSLSNSLMSLQGKDSSINN